MADDNWYADYWVGKNTGAGSGIYGSAGNTEHWRNNQTTSKSSPTNNIHTSSHAIGSGRSGNGSSLAPLFLLALSGGAVFVGNYVIEYFGIDLQSWEWWKSIPLYFLVGLLVSLAALSAVFYTIKKILKIIKTVINYLTGRTKRLYWSARFRVSDLPEKYHDTYKQAVKGKTNSQKALGKLYFDGEGLTKDYSKAAKWYKKASKYGDPQSLFVLSVMHNDGLGVSKNLSKSRRLLIKSAKSGYPESMYRLGKSYIEEKKSKRKIKKGVSYIKSAAEKKNEGATSFMNTIEYQAVAPAAVTDKINIPGNKYKILRIGKVLFASFFTGFCILLVLIFLERFLFGYEPGNGPVYEYRWLVFLIATILAMPLMDKKLT